MPYRIIQEYAKILNGHPALMIRGPISVFTMAIPWQSKVNELPTFNINKGRDCLISVDEHNYFQIAIEEFVRYHHGEVSIAELTRRYDKLASDVWAFYDRMTDISMRGSSIEELLSFMEEAKELFLDIARVTIYIETVDHEKILGVIGNSRKAMLDEIWETASHPTFMSFEGRRLKFLIDLIEAGKLKAVRKAKFIFTDYVWTKKEAEIDSELKSIAASLPHRKEEYGIIKRNVSARRQEYERWRDGLAEEPRRIADFLQMVMLFRDTRKDVIAQIQAVLVELSEELLGRIGIDPKHAPFILIPEYLKGVEHLKSILADIEQRHKGFISIIHPDLSYSTELCDFDRALVEFDQAFFDQHDKTGSLVGQIANKGKAMGTVRIVLDPHDDKGFKQGDILVTSMTRPEFVPLMKKAAAVVTNEGGVTCHAAIVSRELNIPCIIGTKRATMVLKDGDVVEVDAMKGMVTKIG